MGQTGSEIETGATTDVRMREETARRYKVVLHNDDFTTRDFVVEILMTHFGRSRTEATYVMLQVHHKGRGVAGVYPRATAEDKVAAVTREARAQGMPLKLTIEVE